MTNFEYIRAYYNVPARRGARVRYRGKFYGTITSASNGVNIRLDGEKHARPYHPTWELEYLDKQLPLQPTSAEGLS